jgi:hypothetical protein
VIIEAIFFRVFFSSEISDCLLKTIFTYVEPNSEDANRIRDNFLLVEYEPDSNSIEICEHDIDLEGFSTIRINKIRTNNFKEIYTALSDLVLPISAMDIRKVQNVVKEIYAGGSIKVNITEDLDSLDNSDKIIAIGSTKTNKKLSLILFASSELGSTYVNIVFNKLLILSSPIPYPINIIGLCIKIDNSCALINSYLSSNFL